MHDLEPKNSKVKKIKKKIRCENGRVRKYTSHHEPTTPIFFILILRIRRYLIPYLRVLLGLNRSPISNFRYVMLGEGYDDLAHTPRTPELLLLQLHSSESRTCSFTAVHSPRTERARVIKQVVGRSWEKGISF